MAGQRELKVVILGDASHARRAMKQLESAGSSMGDKLAHASKRAAQAFSVIGAGAAAAIFKVGTDYQQSLNVFESVSRANAATMDEVRAKAKALGADMSLPATSAADAAAAMTELVKAGLSVNDTLAASKGVLQLAAAAQITEAEAATITANALNAFGLKGTDAIKVADLLAAAANASSGEITDVGMAFSQASAVFASAKVPIDDVTAAIGLMANKGVIGSDAGTSLRSMLLKLQSPSKEAAGTMADLGVEVYDARGRMKSMRDIIGQFTAKTTKLTQEQRDNALATIFGSDAVRAANIVLTQGTEAFDTMREAVNRQGAAGEVAAAKTKGLKGAIEGLKSQLETVAITIFERVAPSLERFVRKVGEVVPKAAAWFEKHLIPAIDKIYKFVETKLVPVFKSFGGYVTNTLLPALEPAANFLKGELLGAFDKVRDVVVRNREKLKEIADFILLELVPQLMELVGVLVQELAPAFAFVVDSGIKIIDWFKDLYRWVDKTLGVVNLFRDSLRLLTGNLGFNPSDNFKNITPEQFDKTFGVERPQRRKGGGYGMTGSWTDNSVTVNVNGGKSDRETGEAVAREVGWRRRTAWTR